MKAENEKGANMLFERFAKVEPVLKGWSEDTKYCVAGYDGTKYLLRITPAERFEVRKALFEMMKRVAALGVPMCQPVEFGTCPDGVYAMHSWIDGEDLRDAMASLSQAEQYRLGVKSGEILQVIHSIPPPENEVDFLPYRKNWAERFNRKADRNIKSYQDCERKVNAGEHFVKYIDQNRHLLENRPQCFHHGDYHEGNMMVENGELRIIDFDRFDYGDPWEEFNRIVWSAQLSPHFAAGQLNGYFNGEPPLEFFKLLAFYISSNMLVSVSWALNFGHKETETMTNQAREVLEWYDNMNNPVPSWYLKDYNYK
jgi:aminoglycoside phosphotransferase (APT) family kinase protein